MESLLSKFDLKGSTATQSLPIVIGLSAVGLGFLVKYQQRSRNVNPNHLPLPPGPKRLPLIGNALDIPTTNMAQIFHDHAKVHGMSLLCLPSPFGVDKCVRFFTGDIVYYDALGQPIVVLDDYEDATELLDRRSANFSSRAPSVMIYLYVFISDGTANIALVPWASILFSESILTDFSQHRLGVELRPDAVRIGVAPEAKGVPPALQLERGRSV